MKSISQYLTVFLFLFSSLQCSNNESVKIKSPFKKKQNQQVRLLSESIQKKQPRRFQIDRTASQLIVTAVKNGDTPVKGTLNLKAGELRFFSKKQPSYFAIDLTSWNSDLVERDQRIKVIFFDVEKYQTMRFTLNEIPENVITALSQKQAVKNIEITGEFEWSGKTHPISAVVNISYDPKGFLNVVNTKPVEVDVKIWSMLNSLQQLMKACQHKNISETVEVDFELRFVSLSF